MNKQTDNIITSAKKVSEEECKMSSRKTYHVSKSDKEHTASNSFLITFWPTRLKGSANLKSLEATTLNIIT